MSAASVDRPGGAAGLAVALSIGDADLRAEVAAALRQDTCPHVLVDDLDEADVAITDHDVATDLPVLLIGSRSAIEDAVRRGTAGGLSRAFEPAQLWVAITAAAHGLACLPVRGSTAGRRAGTSSRLGARTIADRQRGLTPREAEVLDLLVTGASNKLIARRLAISVHTVKFHVAAIIAKLGAAGRTDAVARVLRGDSDMI